ncbi:beta-propeller fold lactonase family protein [Quisquiliibacterium transsilvanicum]|uniref:YVTN family beta-propeller protein n=1 Tax=Quisquiliibacterium transsilvanicum TaxID=1549638 RepID=A0A7W8HHZ3_9BURK|nr:beta-propeller fold lactonase family protein [Quisquiliibacterium transsilvanicum]MBB5272394.1 YVTN family beta-propeller protein [Quisquiliibacterium transsilvanicum]
MSILASAAPVCADQVAHGCRRGPLAQGVGAARRAGRLLLALACAAACVPAAAQIAVVLNSRDASVSLIDQKTFAEVGRVDVGKEPHHLYPTPDGKSLIIANAMSDDLHLLDPVTGQVQSRQRGIEDPYQIGFSPDNKWFVVNALRLDRVDIYRYDGKALSVAARLPLPKAPSHVWFSADSRFAFVTLQESESIAAIDLGRQQVVWQMRVGKLPAGIIVTPDDRFLMVGIMGEDCVAVVDWRAQKLLECIRTGRGAHNFRGQGDRRHVFVSNRVENTISRIDMTTMKVVDTIAVPGGPDDMEITADGRHLWVTSRFAKQVCVVDIAQRKVVQRIPVGRSPHGIYFHNRAPLL